MHFPLLIYLHNRPIHVSNRLTIHHQEVFYCICSIRYRGADKSLARPTSRCIFFMVRIFRLLVLLCVCVCVCVYIYIYIYIYI